MFDSWESAVAVIVAVLIAYAVILWLGTVVWTYRDIRDRTRDGWFHVGATLLVLLFNIPGLFLYMLLRPPETLAEAYERRIEAEALMREMPQEHAKCPRCQRAVNEEFLLCPNCRTNLREPCLGCGRPLELSWIACPYCGAQGPQAATAAAAAPSPAAPQRPFADPILEGAPPVSATGSPQPGPTGQRTP